MFPGIFRYSTLNLDRKNLMTQPILLPSPESCERHQLLNADYFRAEALKRLYERREAVNSLIHSLEIYERTAARGPVGIEQLIAARKCS